MSIHLEEDIQEMLYENGSVVIPGVGAFKGNYKSAYIDGVQGHLAPPSLEITFDSNSLINDGIFVDFLKKKYQISLQEAQNAIDVFARNAISTFEKHELVVIPQVGRLYRDFNHRIQFLPDSTNFNTDTFALPAAQFYPVSRTVVEKTAVVEAIKNDTPPPPINPNPKFPETTTDIPYPVIDTREADEDEPVKWRKIVPALTTAVLFILAFSIYMHNQNKEKENPKVEKPKVNVSPSKPEGTAPSDNNTTPAPPIASTKQTDTKTIANEKMLNNRQNTEGGNSTLVPPVTTVKENKARVICGAFGDANNINRHKKWFAANGYGVYEKQRGAITVLGADVAYSDKKDLNRIVARLQERFGVEAVSISKK
jgi:hypothetical protein